jgi:hypothetical protein
MKSLIIFSLTCIGGALYAQGTRMPEAGGSAHDALLAEVRTLRAEINRAASASIRMQLLVARLQLQEQRVFTAGQQLVEVQDSLAVVRMEIAGEQARVGQLENQMSRVMAQAQVPIQQAMNAAKTQIEQQQRRQRELEVREAEHLKAVDNERIRWADFNHRLDALERSLPAAVSH